MVNFPVKLWLTFQSNYDWMSKELGIIAFPFASFSDGLNTTNVSSSAVKKLDFSGQK